MRRQMVSKMYNNGNYWFSSGILPPLRTKRVKMTVTIEQKEAIDVLLIPLTTHLNNLNGCLFWTLQSTFLVDKAGTSLVPLVLDKFQWGSPHIYHGPYSGMSRMYSLLRKKQ